MNEQCKFQVGKYNCGSYAFNLYKENIEQGDYCDRHYWQDRAVKAEVLVDAGRADEREACAKVCEELPAPDEYSITDKSMWDITCMDCADAIRARGERA